MLTPDVNRTIRERNLVDRRSGIISNMYIYRMYLYTYFALLITQVNCVVCSLFWRQISKVKVWLSNVASATRSTRYGNSETYL